jgi:hypothetical protein
MRIHSFISIVCLIGYNIAYATITCHPVENGQMCISDQPDDPQMSGPSVGSLDQLDKNNASAANAASIKSTESPGNIN